MVEDGRVAMQTPGVTERVEKGRSGSGKSHGARLRPRFQEVVGDGVVEDGGDRHAHHHICDALVQRTACQEISRRGARQLYPAKIGSPLQLTGVACSPRQLKKRGGQSACQQFLAFGRQPPATGGPKKLHGNISLSF